MDTALEWQTERGPAPRGGGAEDGVSAEEANRFRVRVPVRPMRRIDDVTPDALAGCGNG